MLIGNQNCNFFLTFSSLSDETRQNLFFFFSFFFPSNNDGKVRKPKDRKVGIPVISGAFCTDYKS